MEFNWQSLILLHAVFSAFQALQFRAIARVKATRHAGLAVNAIALTASYICGLLILPLIGGDAQFDIFIEDFLLYFSASSLIMLALFFMYKAMAHLESAIASVLGTSSALFAVLLAIFFFGEKLSSLQIFGIGMLVACIWYVLTLARKGKKLIDFHDQSWIRGFVFMIISSFCLAFGHILEKAIFEKSSVATYVAYGWLLQVILAWGLYLLLGQHTKKIFSNNKAIRSALQLGLFRAVSSLLFVLALVKSDSVSLVATVANFRIIIVAVLAGWLLGEKQYYYKKMAAAALSVVALSIIFWN